MHKILKLAAVASVGVTTFIATPFHDARASQTDTDARENVVKIVSDMENIMMRSYMNETEEIEKLASKGYDFDLTSQSFYSQGLPYTNYEYLEFIAAYSTIQNYCLEKGIDMAGGINEIDFVNSTYEDATETEYIPKKVDRYVENEEGKYLKDGYTYITEPCDIATYEKNEDGTYEKTGTQRVDLEKTEIKYASMSLSTISPEDIYKTYGLNREDFEEEENERYKKLNEIMGDSDVGQTVFIESSTAMTEEQKSIIDESAIHATTDQQKQIISIASSIIGKVPYEWGGKSTKSGVDETWYTFDESGRQKGLDCSGYVQWVLRTANVDGWEELGSTAADLTSKRLQVITSNEILPGDLGFFYPAGSEKINHVGIYLGDGKWIHCSSSANTVTITDNIGFTLFRRFLDIETKEEVKEKEENISVAGEDSEAINDDSANVENVETDINIEDTDEEKVEEVREDTSSKEPESENASSQNIEDNDIMLMAKIVQCESQAEGYNGWVAVAQVIRNRILSPKFSGSNIKEIVSAPRQFSTYKKASNMTDNEVNMDIYKVCQDVMAGNLRYFEDDSIIGFKVNDGDENWNGWTRYTILGNHAFYK